MNQDQERFLIETYPREYDKVRGETVKAFSSLEPWERRWNTDFTMQPLEVLQPALNQSVFAPRTNFAIRTLSLLTRYATWRRKDGLPCTDAIWRAEPDTSYRKRLSMVASPRHLRRVLDTAFEPAGSQSAEVLYRTFLWLAFMGVEDSEAIGVQAEQVSLSNLTLAMPDRTLMIPAEAVGDIAFCVRSDSLLVQRNVYGRIDSVERERTPGTALLRGAKGVSLSFKRFQDAANARLRSARASFGETTPGLSVTYDLAHLSGFFWNIFEDERMGESPNFNAIAYEVFDRRQSGQHPYKVTKYFSAGSIAGRIARSFQSDYESWKRAFNA